MSINQPSKIQLNENQKKAVQHKTGPLLVVAGAGTGKTRVITERISHLIKDQKVKPDEILAVTFTEKASQEMLERLDRVMPLGYSEPWICTFHAFADRLLKAEGLELGLDSSYKIMSYPDQWLLLRQNIFKFELKYYRPLGNPTKFISAILKFISRLQDEYISPTQLNEFALGIVDPDEKSKWMELSHVYEKYEDLKLQHSKMDFGDLIIWAIRLFEQRPNILRKYQEKFKHVLVDEFQDTNYAQYHLIKLLCPVDMQDRSLLVVGDDSQSIYKFRGAAVSNILEFQRDYPQAAMVTLLDNFRSTQEILDPSYKLITNNNPDTLESKLGISKELVSKVTTVGPKAKAIQAATLEDEVDFVVKEILELLGKEPSYNYKDFAILARANSHLDPFIFALRKYGLPYQLVGNRGLYDRDEVRDIMAILRVIINSNDTISLYRVLNNTAFDIPTNVISKILTETKFKKLDMWEITETFENDNLQRLISDIKKYQEQITDKTPVEFVYELVNSIGYLNQYTEEETLENQLSINNLNLFLDKVKNFEVSYRSDYKMLPTIVDFVDYLDLMVEAGENPAQAEIEDIQTIKLLTVHASKGLEFPVVFMVNLVAGRFPTRNRRDTIEIPDELVKEILPAGDPHIQEERRLFYVGMTRAQKYLYLTCGKNYGGKRDMVPSGYLEETGLSLSLLEEDVSKKQEPLFGANSEFRSPKVSKTTSHIPYSLSYSKLESYKTCPLQYKYNYVLNIPTPPSHALSFGITIHDTLRDYYAKRIVGEDVTLDSLFEIYDKNWQPLGYMGKDHQEVRFESGKELLKNYYEKHKNNKVLPKELEKGFNIKLSGIKFFGRIDRIDPLPDGTYEIIDYKTGSTKSQKDVDKDDQVALYALAAKQAFGIHATKLSYYFLEEGVKVTTERSDKNLEEMHTELESLVEEIKKGDFTATPGMHCTWCDFKDICPYAYKS